MKIEENMTKTVFKLIILTILIGIPGQSVLAKSANNGDTGQLIRKFGLINGISGESIGLDQALDEVRPGDIVVIGENHGFKTHQNNQLDILHGIKARGLKVSLGMEFFYYPDQDLVNQYLSKEITEETFLQKINWGSPSFDYYRDQVLTPDLNLGESVIALNLPRNISGKIAKTGLVSLTSDELLYLPPGFQLGRDSYKERFLASMPHLPSPEKGDNYFAAQSSWDDTMAWKAMDYVKSHKDTVFVIIVGDFHVQYGGGLPDRLKARGAEKIITFSLFNSTGWDENELSKEVLPSPVYGPRADYVWVND